ncbi:MAG: Na+/H+ antiporter NhaA [Chitinophagaceae bacterium]
MILKILRHTFLNPLKEFIHDSKAIGIVLCVCTLISLFLANVSFGNEYILFWSKSIDGTVNHSATVGFLHLPNTIQVWINDALMALFFLLAGLEIKRELVEGELNTAKKAAMPLFAAIGGMLIPALLFVAFNANTSYTAGWAIPTATDIAFTIGIMNLLGNKVPMQLKVFVTALAIIDDLGAIIVIALFYGTTIQWMYLGLVVVAIFLILIANKFVKFGIVQYALGIIIWYAMFNSGLHATIAGVIFAALVPNKCLTRLQLKLHVPVYFIVMPVFALANTVLQLNANSIQLTNSLSLGIIIGLIAGKAIGITVFSYAMQYFKFASLPSGVNFTKFFAAAILCGIGFTMSIFISTLAFKDIEIQNQAKIAVLFASLLAGVIGFIVMSFGIKNSNLK